MSVMFYAIFYRFAQNYLEIQLVFVHFNLRLKALFQDKFLKTVFYEFFHPFYSYHASFLPNFEPFRFYASPLRHTAALLYLI